MTGFVSKTGLFDNLRRDASSAPRTPYSGAGVGPAQPMPQSFDASPGPGRADAFPSELLGGQQPSPAPRRMDTGERPTGSDFRPDMNVVRGLPSSSPPNAGLDPRQPQPPAAPESSGVDTSPATPDRVQNLDFTGRMADPHYAKIAIDRLPPEDQDRARRLWALQKVGQDRANANPYLQRIEDSARRMGNSFYPLSEYSDELNAAVGSLAGDDYDMRLAYERAVNQYVAQGDDKPLLETPLGDIYPSGIEKAIGFGASAAALPMIRPFAGTGAFIEGSSGALTGMAYGGLGGFGAGEGGLENRIESAKKPAGVGALAGSAAGALLSRGTPYSRNIAEAADRASVRFPKVAAYDPIVQGTVRPLAEIPLVGSPLRNASTRAIDDMRASASRTVAAFVRGGDTNAHMAGTAVGDVISDWVRTGSTTLTRDAFNHVGQMISPGAMGRLTNTAREAAGLHAADVEAATATHEPILQALGDALSRPNGLTYQGLVRLRENISGMINWQNPQAARIAQHGLRDIRRALTRDIEVLVNREGGPQALSAWRNANTLNERVSRWREELGQIIGTAHEGSGAVERGVGRGHASPEQITGRLIDMASSNYRGDITALEGVRNITPDSAWGLLAGHAIERMGQGRGGQFNIGTFADAYGRMTQAGRRALFAQSRANPGLMQNLDDLALLSQRLRDLERFGNSSGTARAALTHSAITGAGVALYSGVYTPLYGAAAGGLAGRVAAWALSRPLTAQGYVSYVRMAMNYRNGAIPEGVMKSAIIGAAGMFSKATGAPPGEIIQQLQSELGIETVDTPDGAQVRSIK